MRTLTAPLAAAFTPGAAGSLCTCWILRRRDGTVLGFTEHDLPVTLNGVVCAAATGMTPDAAAAELGQTPGAARIEGVLDAAAITEADIAAGLYDGASLEAWRLDWAAPASSALRVWRGTIARLTRNGSAFQAEIAGPLAALAITVGRTYQRSCDAVLGDARCGVNMSLPANAGATCDKDWRTCRDRFANLINFQGFPDIPGDDFLAVYATDSPGNTGGSRRR
jgi:hypothetical protein